MAKKKVKIDFGLVTVRDFLALMMPQEEAPDLRMFHFCNKVIVGGIMDFELDALPAIAGQVAEEIQRFCEAIKAAIEMGQMLGEIDEYLNLEGGTDGRKN